MAHKEKYLVKKILLLFLLLKKFFPEYDRGEMVERYWKFSDVKIEKKKFCSSEEAINVKRVDIEKTLAFNKIVYGKNKETDTKYFIGNKIGKKN